MLTESARSSRVNGVWYDLLVRKKLITFEELLAAIDAAADQGVSVESLLLHHVDRRELGATLSEYYKVPFEPFDETAEIPESLVRETSPKYLRANHWVPLREEDESVVILIDDPRSHHKIEDIGQLFHGRPLSLRVGLQEDILRYVKDLERRSDPRHSKDAISNLLVQLEVDGSPEKKAQEPEALDESDSTIVKLANQIIIDAKRAGASDIHIEPYSRDETVIRFRVDGECSVYQKVPSHFRKALTSRVKIMAGLDISERRKPQDGKIRFILPDHEAMELRVATIPTAGDDNEDVVLRILASSKPVPLAGLNMAEANLKSFERLLARPHGIILCVGPTGSGKTTTLHSALGHLNSPDVKIWTAEDPVEITQHGLRQVQVQPKLGFDFAAAMRAFLRADPDVIMVGEMRDSETIETAIKASLTGHLVLSTLHTNSAVETVTRLLDMGVDPFNFADALQGVLAQRLVRTLCPRCREAYAAPRLEYDELRAGFGEQAWDGLGVAYDAKFALYRGKGCEACRFTGYKGRTGIHELLIVTEEFKRLILTRATVSAMLDCARSQGMKTLLQDGILKCLKGSTDYRQVRSVALA